MGGVDLEDRQTDRHIEREEKRREEKRRGEVRRGEERGERREDVHTYCR